LFASYVKFNHVGVVGFMYKMCYFLVCTQMGRSFWTQRCKNEVEYLNLQIPH